MILELWDGQNHFMLNKTGNTYSIMNVEITNNQVLWVLMLKDKAPFIYRIDQNGVIIQIIWFGSLTLTFATTVSQLNLLSENDFILMMDLSLINANMSVGPTTGTDLSIARLSTDLRVQ